MTIRGVNNVHISPLERPGRRCERCRGILSLKVNMIMSMVMTIFAWAGSYEGEQRQKRSKAVSELHDAKEGEGEQSWTYEKTREGAIYTLLPV